MAAASLLPPLLPTPPRSEMMPILPTPPRSTMLPLLPTPSGLSLLMAVSTMPGRADFVKKWDTTKKYKVSCNLEAALSSCSDDGRTSCRADAVERWDAHKKYKTPGSAASLSSSSSSGSGGSPGRADSVERWDSKKLVSAPRGRSPPTDRGHLQLQDGNNKRAPSRESSADRWDLHKKARPEEMDKLPQTDHTTTAAMAGTTVAVHKEMARMQQSAFAGPNFYASPEPTMLPMPSFFLRAH